MTFSGNHSHGMLPGLHPFSLYSFHVRVFNGKGEGPPSPSQQFETPEGGMRMRTFFLFFYLPFSLSFFAFNQNLIRMLKDL